MNQSKKVMIAGLAALLSITLGACDGGSNQVTVTGPYFTGYAAKLDYNAYITQAPSTLGSITSQNAVDVMHIANFSDTLLMNDEYGILRKSLAAEAYHNQDNTEFRFRIRDDVYWRTYDGEIYKARNSTGEYVEQKVCADDFLQAAQAILTYSNNSEIYYMYTLFIDNAWEYYLYTMMSVYISNQQTVNGFDYGTLKGDYDAQAEQLMVLIEEYSGSEADPITGSDISAISKFERVGVQVEVVDGEEWLVYTLNRSASYFPTVLTYTPYMPINRSFYSGLRSNYGKDKASILYIGPYFLEDMSTTSMTYKKNPYYHDADSVHIDTINYTVADTSMTYADMRNAYESGEIDGFTLNQQDTVGWQQYITGPDGTGTIQQPYDGSVNSRELDDISYTYHFVLNPNRSLDVSGQNDTFWADDGINTESAKVAQIQNTNAALKIKEVRKAVLNGIDMSLFNTRNQTEDNDQYQINTYTPRGFIQDENNKDYVEYYYEEYAERKGITYDEAVKAVGPQQVSDVYMTDNNEYVGINYTDGSDALSAMMNDARSAIQQAANQGLVSLPVTISYLSSSALSTETLTYDQGVVRSFNERINGCTINSSSTSGLPLCEAKDSSGNVTYPYFYMKMNSPTSSAAFSSATESGEYTIYTGWGWIGDYADPLTYLHTYVTNGEMSAMCGNNTDLDNYHLDEAGTLVKDDTYMFDEFNAMVNSADAIVESNSARYEAFAEAEYYLLNELWIMKPSQMTSQGWVASVSRAAGYENPQASYGLADNIMKGMWVLVTAPTAAERQAARDLQAERKAAALEEVNNDTIAPAFD